MNLTVDIGNTLTKAAVFEEGQLVDTFRFEGFSVEYLERVYEIYPDIKNAITVCTRKGCEEADDYLSAHVSHYIRFKHGVKVPLKNLYKTPQTLGYDRLAAAVGAATLYPGCNALVCDFGSAITIDVVTAAGVFIGGNISPGAGMRFRALNHFTGKLPLRELPEQTVLIGGNTFEAIEGGVVNGIVFELEGYIERVSEQFRDLRLIFTGGDGDFFANRLKNPIFVTYDLVLYGLNRILEYNIR